MANRKSKQFESYVAHASVKAGASARAITSAYKIEVRFLGGLTTTCWPPTPKPFTHHGPA